jgi:NTE family protein
MRGRFDSYAKRSPRLDCPHGRTLDLAQTPTRLCALPRERRERIVNWGYALCDAGMRTWVDPQLPEPAGFPFPAVKV